LGEYEQDQDGGQCKNEAHTDKNEANIKTKRIKFGPGEHI